MENWMTANINLILLIGKMLIPVLMVLLIVKMNFRLPAWFKALLWQISFIIVLIIPVLNYYSFINLPLLPEIKYDLPAIGLQNEQLKHLQITSDKFETVKPTYNFIFIAYALITM